jgi:ubiquinone/menaquinone biosynthesis C-methylase UbiE
MPTEPLTEPTPFDDGALYDVVMGKFDIDLEFYLGLARAARGPVLDVACGTGRIMLPCLRAGIDVDGLDLSAEMLARLRQKASAEGFDSRLYESSMSSLSVPRRYALIMIPFNAIVHNLTTEDQLATLTRCRDHLEPGGVLAFDTGFPGAAWITAPDGVRVLELETKHPDTGLPVRMFDTRSFNRVEQIMDSRMEIELLDAAGNVAETRRSRTTIRWIYKFEMALLLRVAGFERWEIYGDYKRRPLTQETDALIVQAWKGAK